MSTCSFRTGIGIDVHAYCTEAETAENPQRLCKVATLTWPGETPLSGHSDADVVAHAICDALFSAAGLGDLGSNFGVDQPQWAGASGQRLLLEAKNRLSAAGFAIANVSVQMIGARPRIGDRRLEAQEAISGILDAPVSFSSTTTDHLGFLGRREGLAALASALVYLV